MKQTILQKIKFKMASISIYSNDVVKFTEILGKNWEICQCYTYLIAS